MTDYANQDVDRLRIIADYCEGTEHGVFLAGLADRMEGVIVEVAQPVFTREDVNYLRMGDPLGRAGHDDVLDDLADRIEQTLPPEASGG